ncbi:glycosyltransferase [Marinilactibacillus sp. GCM10026970]|uniref:glycosyltransferase n=1 Tax=Marinilactibacillus sp. GCM10026970 TaxID=3252642 RepID=UPI003607CC6C
MTYSDGQFPSYIWDRYLEHFDELKVLSRFSESDKSIDVSKLDVSSREEVDFKLVGSLSSIKSQLKDKKEIKTAILKEVREADAVICRLPSFLGRLTASIAIKENKPLAIEVVADAWDELWNYGNIKGKMFAPISFFYTRYLTKKSKYTLYVTKEYLQNRYPSNGITTSCSNVELAVHDETVLDKRLNKTNQNRIGLIAALGAGYKGIDTAIAAIAEIKEKHSDFSFHILGNGDATKWIELAKKYNVEDIVFFDGTLPSGAAVYEWLDEIDVYIHPSRQEGLPRAVIEAMSRACPVIASTIAGIPELIDSENLHAPGDSKKLAKLLDNKLENHQWKKDESIKNFHKSSHYKKENLNIIRNSFWGKFYNYSLDNK